MSIIKIGNDPYEVIDSSHRISMADSAVCRKLKIGQGNGERKIYFNSNQEEFNEFFGTDSELKFILKKNDFIEYLDKAEVEYKKPTQEYINNITEYYHEIRSKIESLGEIVFFSCKQSIIDPPRRYFNWFSHPHLNAFRLIGDTLIPRYSYMHIVKIKKVGTNCIFFYLKPFYERPQADSKLALDMYKVRGRPRQAEYREKLLRSIPYCIITKVVDDFLLISSHIKPFRDCNESEKYDPNNGLIFTPTFDRLFDQGYLTINDDKTVSLSVFLGNDTKKKLKIVEGMPCHDFDIKNRIGYLKYHRNEVFLKAT